MLVEIKVNAQAVSNTFREHKCGLTATSTRIADLRTAILIYGGLGPVGLQRCEFLNVRLAFVDAASNTLAFMAGLYHGAGEGGRTVIEETFDGIRRGHPPTPEPVTATEEAESTAPDERTSNRA